MTRRRGFAFVKQAPLLFSALFATAATPQWSVFAASDLLAVTGDMQPGASGAELLGLLAPTLNEAGQVVFRATLKQGVGPIDSSNDRAVWRFDGAAPELIAWAGVGGVPGGGSYDVFQAASIGDAGEVVIRATNVGGRLGLWRYPSSPGAASMIAATGVTGVPGLPTSQFEAFDGQLLHAPANIVPFNGKLALEIGIVTPQSDRGLWVDVAGQQSLIAREQLTTTPGVDDAQFRFPGAAAINNQAQAVILGSMIDGVAGVTTADSQAIWRMSAGGGDLIARRNFGGVAGVPGASYLELMDATINNVGQVAFGGELVVGGAVTSANNRGVWFSDGAAAQMLLQSGSAPAGVSGASFAAFGAPILNDAGQVLVSASLVEGVGGVTADNSQGLWIVDFSGGILIGRTGSGGVPGAPGSDFASFGALAFNEYGMVAVEASLTNVAPGTEQGLWIMDAAGDGVLVARTGDVVGTRTIAALEFTGGSGGSDGRQRALNSSGQLAYKATFTNGDEGLFLYSPGAAADFTSDGSVDGADLLKWKVGFGQDAGAGRAEGDADRDGDVDGNDFLLWQRQLSASVPLAAIPEPPLAAILLPVWLVAHLRLNLGVRSASLAEKRSPARGRVGAAR